MHHLKSTSRLPAAGQLRERELRVRCTVAFHHKLRCIIWNWNRSTDATFLDRSSLGLAMEFAIFEEDLEPEVLMYDFLKKNTELCFF